MRLHWIFPVAILLTFDLCQGKQQSCINVATYNAALLKQIGRYEERRHRVATGLLQTNSDVYCLQEIWLERDLDQILKVMEEFYPYHYSGIHAQLNALRKPQKGLLFDPGDIFRVESACTDYHKYYFMYVISGCIQRSGCLQEYAKSNLQGTVCLVENCGSLLRSNGISADCFQCLVTFSVTVSNLATECYGNTEEKKNRMNSLGLAVLSKRPIKSAKHVSFHSQDSSFARGYIEAEIDGFGKFVCTHLSSVFPLYVEYELSYGSYLRQQNVEIDYLFKEFNTKNHVLLGDLNTGPEVVRTGVKDEFGQNYQRFVDAGYTNNYVQQVGKCTYCKNNTLVDHNNVIVDHIMIKGNHISATSSSRVIDRECDYCPLSDHYGTETTLCTNP